LSSIEDQTIKEAIDEYVKKVQPVIGWPVWSSYTADMFCQRRLILIKDDDLFFGGEGWGTEIKMRFGEDDDCWAYDETFGLDDFTVLSIWRNYCNQWVEDNNFVFDYDWMLSDAIEKYGKDVLGIGKKK